MGIYGGCYHIADTIPIRDRYRYDDLIYDLRREAQVRKKERSKELKKTCVSGEKNEEGDKMLEIKLQINLFENCLVDKRIRKELIGRQEQRK